MAEQQDRLGGLAGEIHLQVISEVFRTVEANFAAELRKFVGYELGHAVGGGFVVAGRFDFDQLAHARDDLVAAVFEVS
jgi:hypothetical protein